MGNGGWGHGGLPKKHPSVTTEQPTRCSLPSSRGLQGLAAMPEGLGAVLQPGVEFPAGKQDTQVQNEDLLSSLPTNAASLGSCSREGTVQGISEQKLGVIRRFSAPQQRGFVSK